MKKDEFKANKIITKFKAKAPLLTVMAIYDCKEGTVIKALTNPEEIKMGIPFYQLIGDIVINANPLGRPDWFKEVVQDDNCIYQNTDIDRKYSIKKGE